MQKKCWADRVQRVAMQIGYFWSIDFIILISSVI